MSPFKLNKQKLLNIQPDTGSTIPSPEDQFIILRDLRAITDNAAIFSIWSIWVIFGDGYTLHNYEIEINEELTWHQLIENRLNIHRVDRRQLWTVSFMLLEQWDLQTIGRIIRTALDATNVRIGFPDVLILASQWDIPIISTIPFSYRQYALLIRSFLPGEDFLSNKVYLSSINRRTVHTQGGLIPFRLVANATALLLYEAARPLLMHAHYSDTKERIIMIMKTSMWKELICNPETSSIFKNYRRCYIDMSMELDIFFFRFSGLSVSYQRIRITKGTTWRGLEGVICQGLEMDNRVESECHLHAIGTCIPMEGILLHAAMADWDWLSIHMQHINQDVYSGDVLNLQTVFGRMSLADRSWCLMAYFADPAKRCTAGIALGAFAAQAVHLSRRNTTVRDMINGAIRILETE
jgi:hypothetical protein